MQVKDLMRFKLNCREAVYEFLSALTGGGRDLNSAADEIMEIISDYALYAMAESRDFEELQSDPDIVLIPEGNIQGQGAA